MPSPSSPGAADWNIVFTAWITHGRERKLRSSGVPRWAVRDAAT